MLSWINSKSLDLHEVLSSKFSKCPKGGIQIYVELQIYYQQKKVALAHLLLFEYVLLAIRVASTSSMIRRSSIPIPAIVRSPR